MRVRPAIQNGHTEEISTKTTKHGSVPVLVAYDCIAGCDPPRDERVHNDPHDKKRAFFERYDLTLLKKVDAESIPYWCPPHKMMNIEDDSVPWGIKWRPGRNFRSVAELFTKRNLWAFSAVREADGILEISALNLFLFNRSLVNGTKSDAAVQPKFRVSQHAACGHILLTANRPRDRSVGMVCGKATSFAKRLQGNSRLFPSSPCPAISTSDARCLDIPGDTIDYIFTDPPYGDSVQYGELNFIWEHGSIRYIVA